MTTKKVKKHDMTLTSIKEAVLSVYADANIDPEKAVSTERKLFEDLARHVAESCTDESMRRKAKAVLMVDHVIYNRSY